MDSGPPDIAGWEAEVSALQRPLDELPDPLPIPTVRGGHRVFDACIRPPGSKSLTNRALLLAALADGVSTLRGPLLGADDAERMIAALTVLGARFDRRDGTVVIRGVGGRWRPAGAEVRLDLGNAGTATRFLAAAALLSPVPVVIDGNARMRERPIGDLAEALRALGARVEHLATPGFPPLRVHPCASKRSEPAAASFGTLASSQFVSALLLAGPWLGGLDLALPENLTSKSYVEMTVGLMRRVGARVEASEDWRRVRVAPGGIGPFEYEVETDASGATYFWAVAAIVPGACVRVPGLAVGSLQGDAAFPDLLARMGADVLRDGGGDWVGVVGPRSLRGVEADLADMPDTAMTAAAVAAFAEGPSLFRGLRTLRVKETDRIEAMRRELGRVGVGVEPGAGGDDGAIRIVPPVGGAGSEVRAPEVDFDTYDDHRMAMSLALIGLRRPGVRVKNPGCVAKTYPGYWQDLAVCLRGEQRGG